MNFRILDLTAARPDLIDGAARVLYEGFRNGSEDWQDFDSARQEVLGSLSEDRISRVAVDKSGSVIGWIGAIPLYRGRVWEIHPLVVGAAHQRRGVGRELVEGLERIVRQKGAVTLLAGSDDENDQTSLSGADLYPDILGAIRNIRNLRGHPYEFYVRIGFTIAGVTPDANGFGKPDIHLAKRV